MATLDNAPAPRPEPAGDPVGDDPASSADGVNGANGAFDTAVDTGVGGAVSRAVGSDTDEGFAQVAAADNGSAAATVSGERAVGNGADASAAAAPARGRTRGRARAAGLSTASGSASTPTSAPTSTASTASTATPVPASAPGSAPGSGSGSASGSVRAGWPAVYTRRLIAFEIVAVLAVSLGRSAVEALLDLITALSTGPSLNQQTATLNGSVTPGHPWLDLTWQIYGIAFGLAPVVLVAYLVAREGFSLRAFGLDRGRPWGDLGRGAGVAAVIGGTGLVLYLVAHWLGLAVTVVPTTLPPVWWRIPVLIASAFQNAAVEEIVILAYLLRRLEQAGWGFGKSAALSAVVRGSYHLYQGFGAFVGNAVMGLVFAWLYRRWGRVTPLLLAHGLIDTVAFVGYALLAGHVSWLPV